MRSANKNMKASAAVAVNDDEDENATPTATTTTTTTTATPVKERKKLDRFNGMPEEEVARRTLPDHIREDLDIVIVSPPIPLMCNCREKASLYRYISHTRARLAFFNYVFLISPLSRLA